jgi:hypothetical protein
MTDEQLALKREAAIRAFNEAKAAKRAAAEAAKPKATVLEMPLEEEVRRALINGRGGQWTVVPYGVSCYRPDPGPSEIEWEMVASRRQGPVDPHEAYSRSLYGSTK